MCRHLENRGKPDRWNRDLTTFRRNSPAELDPKLPNPLLPVFVLLGRFSVRRRLALLACCVLLLALEGGR